MSRRQYKIGVNRDQEHLLPARVEDYVSQSNSVKAVDAYVLPRWSATSDPSRGSATGAPQNLILHVPAPDRRVRRVFR